MDTKDVHCQLDPRALAAVLQLPGLGRLFVDEVISHLKPLLLDNQYDQLILGETSNGYKLQRLTDFLAQGTQDQFSRFVAILRETKTYDDVANYLDEYGIENGTKEWSLSTILELLIRGPVPDFIGHRCQQESKLREIQKALSNAARSERRTRFVVVHGIGGSGKTVLAAQSVRSASLLRQYYMHGVIWIRAGELRGQDDVRDAVKGLLVYVLQHNLVQWPGGKNKDWTLVSLREELSSAVKGRRLLLILDDVWQRDVVNAFSDLPFTVLLTSRHADIVSVVKERAHVEYVHVDSCTESEVKRIVGQIAGDVCDEVMSTLMKRTGRLALAVTVMANCLEGKSREKQEQFIQSKEFLTEEYPTESGYEDITQVLQASLVDLERDTRFKDASGTLLDKYLDLAVSENDEEFTASRLAPIWNRPHRETERCLERLASRALLTCTGAKSASEMIYTVHDVLLEVLQEFVKNREGSLDGRALKWITAFLRRDNPVADLLAEAQRLSQPSSDLTGCNDLWRIIATMTDPSKGKWRQCFEVLSVILAQVNALSPFKRDVLNLMVQRAEEDNGWTAMHEAVFQGDLAVLAALVELGGNIERVTTHNFQRPVASSVVDMWILRQSTLLHVSCLSGHQPINEWLIQRRVDLRATADRGETCLHAACKGGHLDVIRWLMLNGLDIKVTMTDGWTCLHAACNGGHLNVIQWLTQNALDIKVKGNDGGTCLHAACNGGNLSAIKWLTQNGLDVKVTRNDGWTCLHSACAGGNLNAIQWLTQNGLDVKVTTKVGHTCLHSACYGGEGLFPTLGHSYRLGHLDVIKWLTKNGIDIGVTTTAGQTCLHSACYGGHLSVIQWLTQNGLDIKVKDNDGLTCLHSACHGGYISVVQWLTQKGLDIKMKDNNGWSCLHAACQGGHLNVIQWLMQNGLDIRVTDNDGQTCLHSACQGENIIIIQWLMQNGLDIRVTRKDGWTCLHAACQAGHLNVIQWLMENGFDIKEKDNDGQTCLHYACYGGNLDVIKWLAQNGLDIRVTRNDGGTCLHSACFRGHLNAVQWLVQNGLDIKVKDNSGWTCLHSACQEGNLDVIQWLTGNGLDIKVTRNDGWTCLHVACQAGHLNVVQWLTRNGLDVTVKDNDGWTCLHAACQGGHLNIVHHLLQHKLDPYAKTRDCLSPTDVATDELVLSLLRSLTIQNEEQHRLETEQQRHELEFQNQWLREPSTWTDFSDKAQWRSLMHLAQAKTAVHPSPQPGTVAQQQVGTSGRKIVNDEYDNEQIDDTEQTLPVSVTRKRGRQSEESEISPQRRRIQIGQSEKGETEGEESEKHCSSATAAIPAGLLLL